MKNNKVVLAFSGGLDTSYCVKYLQQEMGLEVYAALVNTGGFTEEELQETESRAYSLGVKEYQMLDETDYYYQRSIKYLIFGNVLKNSTYPLSVSAERVTQALAIARYAKAVGAAYVAHGSTGAGNDQVRFDMIFQSMIPDVQILTPIRDNKLSREQEIAYLQQHGVSVDYQKAQYSINKGIWGTSVGGKETLTSHLPLPEEAYPTAVTKQEPERVTLIFEKGELKGIDDVPYENPVQAIQALQAQAAPFGIGRDIHVGDTIIGIKGRVGFEAAAPMVIIKAHHTLEKHVLTKWQLYWKDQLATFYGNWLHEGQLMDPVMRNIEAFLEDTQQNVTGKVHVLLAPYRLQIEGIESDHDLMSSKFGSYGEMNNAWSGDDVKGFARIFGNQTMMYHKINGTEF
ncbi:argininosuccinate synthase [Pontibacter sp. 172403-2]|uniref:argininosuccinate synthase n=1 Tax=Pontibacter rufus TaxID=2791028 RepID=UPI0018AF585F|nr:argininosuccinate synthase domain-containing protein [Pontibacter sp. 172403-2]MBF9253608.1 argininosuccinate synthase [Pontibacter sp. 172403-2]